MFEGSQVTLQFNFFSNRLIRNKYLSYSTPNSSWPIFGTSGSISSTDESEETESHDIARCRRGVPSTGRHSNSEAEKCVLKLVFTVYFIMDLEKTVNVTFLNILGVVKWMSPGLIK